MRRIALAAIALLLVGCGSRSDIPPLIQAARTGRTDLIPTLVKQGADFTGFCSNHAASAVWAWLDMSSLPPNAPPLDTCSTTTCAVVTPSTAAIWLRSSQTP